MDNGRVNIPARTWVEISRGQLAANFRNICKVVGEGVAVSPVVKADAYGHGAVEVSRLLVAEGARWLAVSCVAEGVALREADIGCRILVMGGMLPFEREAAWGADLTPVIHSFEDLRELDALGVARPVHFKVDTGMTRLGARAGAGEVVEALRSLRALRVEGLMSHFASAEHLTSDQSDVQMERFRAVCDAVRAAGFAPDLLHFSSTNGLAYGRRGAWHSLVRPGLALYGYISPSSGTSGPLTLSVKPVLSWRARLVGVKDIPEGTLVGYGGRFRAPKPMRIGVIAAGYADGVPHRLSNRGHVVAGGRLVPILGAVSMDLTTIDLSESRHLGVGDAVTLIGSEGEVSVDAQQIAETAGEISYSVLCGIGNRVRRVYT
ncbi:MAG: alanine racemase [Bryobacterales bacterium]|nr:alanine racemase [Bryobacterales bacterium]